MSDLIFRFIRSSRTIRVQPYPLVIKTFFNATTGILVATQEWPKAVHFCIKCILLTFNTRSSWSFLHYRRVAQKQHPHLFYFWMTAIWPSSRSNASLDVSSKAWRLMISMPRSRADDRHVPYSKVTLLNCAARQSYLTCSSDTLAIHRNLSLDETSSATGAEMRPRSKAATVFLGWEPTTSARRQSSYNSQNLVLKTVCSNVLSAAFKSARSQSDSPSKSA